MNLNARTCNGDDAKAQRMHYNLINRAITPTYDYTTTTKTATY